MNDDFDETELDNPNGSSSGGGFFTLIILLALACGGLYFFRAKIDAFVVKNPKCQKTWMLTCKAGTTAKELSLKAKGLVQEKFAKKN